jgi:hypothetical protein
MVELLSLTNLSHVTVFVLRAFMKFLYSNSAVMAELQAFKYYPSQSERKGGLLSMVQID